MIGQNISLEFLIPIALEKLEIDPFAEGNLYPGDMLCAVLHSDAHFWTEHNDLTKRIRAIVKSLRNVFSDLEVTEYQEVRSILKSGNRRLAE